MDFSRKDHWENIYTTKKVDEVSWFQPESTTSLSFFNEMHIPKDAAIIDIGGGDSFLAENLLNQGYNNLSVLDISANSLGRAQERIGPKAVNINWIIEDVTHFDALQQYDVWHDRAVFHFLTHRNDIDAYVVKAAKAIKPGGVLIVGTFSLTGPTKCSGIEIKQYSTELLIDVFSKDFTVINCFYVDHQTPSKAIQNFTFCSFRKNSE